MEKEITPNGSEDIMETYYRKHDKAFLEKETITIHHMLRIVY